MASVAPQTRIAPPHVHWGVLDFKALRIRSALVHALRVAMATAVLIRTPAQVNVCLERSQLPVRSSATIALQVNFRSVAQPRALRVPLDNIPIVVLRPMDVCRAYRGVTSAALQPGAIWQTVCLSVKRAQLAATAPFQGAIIAMHAHPDIISRCRVCTAVVFVLWAAPARPRTVLVLCLEPM